MRSLLLAFWLVLLAGIPSPLVGADCNGNGTEDSMDVDAGTSPDCNSNGTPDACEQSFVQLSRFAGEIVLPDAPVLLASVDINGDGRPDLITASAAAGDSRLATYFNLGATPHNETGNFSDPTLYRTGQNVGQLASGDLDGDGRIDVVVLTDSVRVFWNEGSGALSGPTVVEPPGRLSGLEVVDLNGDGAADLAVTARTDDRIIVLVSNRDRTFSRSFIPVGDTPRPILSGDFDGDGHADLVTANSGSLDLSIVRNNGEGALTTAEPIALDGPPRGIAVGDFDDNGRSDVAVSVAQKGVTILLSQPNGDLVAAQTFAMESATLKVMDVDDDGSLDIVAMLSSSRALVALLNDGDGFFDRSVDLDESPLTKDFASTDLDDDGDDDFAVLRAGSVTFLWNREAGFQSVPVEFSSFPMIQGRLPHSAVIVDIEDDGDLDLVTGDGSRRTVSVYLNDGSGHFTPGRSGDSGGRIDSLDLGDLDNDGDLDVVVVGTPFGGVHVFKRDEGVFSQRDTLATDDSNSWVTMADFSGDGFRDFVVVGHGGRIALYLNDGAGNFDAGNRQVLQVGSSPRAATHADFDRDGDTDLAVANTGSRDVSILWNDGSARFPRQSRVSVNGGPFTIVTGDWNNDRWIDLAVGNPNESSVAILTNRDGNFETTQLLFSGSSLWSLTTTDLNGDGHSDLIGTSPTSNSVQILLNDRTGRFFLSDSHGVGGGPRFSVTGDIDGDGDADILATNRGTGNITVISNQLDPSAEINFVEHVCTLDDFQTVAVATPTDGLFAKYIIPAQDDPSLLPPIIQNTRVFDLHLEFLLAMFAERFPGLTAGALGVLTETRDTRDYYIGAVELIRTTTGFRYIFSIVTGPGRSEVLTLDEVRWAHEKMSEVFGIEPLHYAPDAAGQNPLAREEALSWVDPGFDVFFGSVITDFDYLAYTEAVGYGRVRLLTRPEFDLASAGGLLTFQDILVTDHAPRDIEGVVGGVITAALQGPLSHVAIRTARRQTPNAFVADALAVFEQYEGELVRLEVREEGFTVEAATQEDAEAFWANRPRLAPLPPVDEEYRDLDLFEDMDLLGAVPPESRYGGKASGLARLQTILTGPWQEYREFGFAIPMAHYLDFMRGNRIPSELEGSLVTYEEYLAEIFNLPQFATDSVLRSAALIGFRNFARDHGEIPAGLVDALAAQIENVFGSHDVATRFRSSSTVEDILDFNGAGLYESTQGCAADSFDGDPTGPSHCDTDKNNERTIERALKKVWTSLWTFRAYEERAFFQVPQDPVARDVAMGILVSRSFLREAANGVAFTGDPTNPRGNCYLVTAQVGEASVVSPEPGVLPEINTLEVVDGRVVNIQRAQPSTLTASGEFVLSDEKLEELGALLWHIDKSYPLDTEGRPRQDILLDIEFKLEPDDSLAVKQVRPFLITNPTRSPTFALEIPPGAMACGTLDVNFPSGSPLLEYRSKSQVRFKPGTFELPAGHCVFASEIFDEVVVGPEQEVAVANGAGVFRVEEQTDASTGRVVYTFNYSQTFSLSEDREFEIRLSGLSFEAMDDVPVEEKLVLDEETITFRLSMAGEAGDSSVNVRYSSCSHDLLPAWNVEVELEGGASVRLRERLLPEETLTFTGPASVEAAQVSIGVDRRLVASYWDLVYSSSRHNLGVKYWVMFDPPLSIEGIEGSVHVLELDAPDPPEIVPPQVAAAAYLDENFDVLARPRVLSFEKTIIVAGQELFSRGDANASGVIGIDDPFRLLEYLFLTGSLPCKKSADANDDGRVNLSDAIVTLLHLFGGRTLPPPFGGCGVDPTTDDLDCREFPGCF